MGELGTDNYLRSDPASDVIQEIITGARRLKILCQTLELGLFDEIESFSSPATSAAIANKCHFNHDVTERLLNTLASIRLLEKSRNSEGSYTYKNAACTGKYLTRSRRPSLIPCCMSESAMVSPALDNLAMALRRGSSDKICQQMMNGEQNNNANTDNGNGNGNSNGNSPPKKMGNNMDRQLMFLSTMDGLTASCSSALTRAFDLSGNKTVADLGGGSGYLAFEMSRTYPNMKLVVFDLPPVANLARKLQPEDTKERVEIVGGDFFKDKLPQADLYVISHVIHDWDSDKTDLLLDKVFSSLPPGGSLLLLEKLLNEDKDGPCACVSMDLVMAVISKGRERTSSEYRRLLKKHGFTNTQIRKISGYNYFDAILAKKPF